MLVMLCSASLLARLPLSRLCSRQAQRVPHSRRLTTLQAALQQCTMGKTPGPAVAAPGPAQFSAALTSIDADKYEEQLDAKVQRIKAQFAEFNPPELEPFRSAPQHYRMRSEFRVWHDRGDADGLYYIMFEKDDKGEQRQVRVDQFPVASELVNALMEGVMAEARRSKGLSAKLFQVNFHTTLSGESMVTLIYHRKLDGAWEAEARRLQETLAKCPGATVPPSIIGRSRGQKVVVGKDEVQEVLEVDGQQLKYTQVEASFSQPNAGMCCSMLSWARSVTAGSSGRDLLELYCGNGNFTVALAPNFRKVVATEVSKSGVAAARSNFELNDVTNVFVARMSSEEFTEAWKTGKAMNRLKGLDLPGCDFQTLLVDPPRAGLDDQTVQLLRDFDNIVYISCNPDTLHANLLEVRDEFEVKRFALFDQFPYTHHIECGVYLERRPGTARAAGAAGTAAGQAAEGAAAAAQGKAGGDAVAAPAVGAAASAAAAAEGAVGPEGLAAQGGEAAAEEPAAGDGCEADDERRVKQKVSHDP